jgi:potassium-dependent mechanosensitive channel
MRTKLLSIFSNRPANVARRWVPVCLLLLALTACGIGQAAAPAGDDSAGKSAIEEIVAKRKDVATQIDALGKQSADADGDVSAADDEREFLETLDGVYGEQQVRLEQRQELASEQAKAVQALDSFRKFGPTEPKPYSFLLLEDLRDELAAEEDHDDALAADLKPATQMLEAAQSHFAQAEKNRRKAQEEVAENKDPDRGGTLTAALKLAQRDSQIAKELIVVRRLEVEVRGLRRDVSASRRTQLTETISQIGEDVHFTKADLQDRLKELTASDAELAAKIKESQSRVKRSEPQQAADLKDLREQRAAPAIVELATASWRVARDAQQIETSLLNERLGDNKRLRHYWECRYEVENGTAKPAEIAEWHESLREFVDELRDNRRSLDQRIEATRLEQAKIVQRMRDEDDPAVKKWGDFQCAQWQELREACETDLVQLKVSERWSGRFLDELEAKLEPRGKDTWQAMAKQRFEAVWSCELVNVNDQPITVGKIANLILCLSLGVVSAKVLSRLLGRQLLRRCGLNEGASHAVQSIAFYSLAVLFGVLSFQLVHIPLAAFAFLGGAVAIAIGFGSQDIANNFMSGIILLAEQPIRVGDIIVVDGVHGTVNHIGPRSTRIKTDANHEMIVPNSKLLSDKVTNLTLSDKLVQTTVAVTLPSKMPVRQAKLLLMQSALSHPAVLKEPRPIVLFKQFAAASMDFELYFWLQLDDEMRAAVAQSEVRESINELFQQNDAQPSISAAPTAGTPPAAMRRANAA